jgi:glyoxylase-like metal-dependent hydrolase (beta-lactamase superfamily II)
MTTPNTFYVPPGAVAQVHILDTGVRMVDLGFDVLLTPKVDGFEKFLPLPAWSFLVESSEGEKVVFDLSFPPDNTMYPPAAVELISGAGVTIDGTKHVADILRAESISLPEIRSVIWSHHHWDHIGDITTFPLSTEVVVGPGFKKAFLPGYPTESDTWVEERHIK